MGGAAALLRRRGLWEESACLEEPGRLAWGADLAEGGRALWWGAPGYPERWVAALGNAAPPCLWMESCLAGGVGCVGSVLGVGGVGGVGGGGDVRDPRGGGLAGRISDGGGGWIGAGPAAGIVGSRQPSAWGRDFAESAAASLLAEGCTVWSGGAVGIDQAALGAARQAEGRAVAVLPCGWESLDPGRMKALEGCVLLSVCEPRAVFSAALAMERNALIYAAGPACLAIEPRLGCGGTWAGAVEARRRRLTLALVASRAWTGSEPGEALDRSDALDAEVAGCHSAASDEARRNGVAASKAALRALAALGCRPVRTGQEAAAAWREAWHEERQGGQATLDQLWTMPNRVEEPASRYAG